MPDNYKANVQKCVKKIAAHAEKFCGKAEAEDFSAFARHFYAGVPLMELEKLEPKAACARAWAAWQFIQKRPSCTPQIRLYTPEEKKHGWATQHTVMEILNDDMPFLVDSVLSELGRQELSTYELIHPILHTERDKAGKLTRLETKGGKGTRAESLIHIEISGLHSKEAMAKLEQDVLQILTTVRLAVEDWQKIMDKLEESITALASAPKSFATEEVAEVEAFLTWLKNKNFVFLGYIEYDFTKDKKGQDAFRATPGSELGIFRLEESDLKPKGLEALPPEVRHFARIPQLIEITKSNRKSVVHRPVHMDYVGLKRFDKQGNVIGEKRFLGLFTSTVYYQSADMIPIIRRKIALTLDRAGFPAVSHDGKALKTILEFFPRDELFQIAADELFTTSLGILALENTHSAGLFMRKDAFERFVSFLVFVPKERFSTEMRLKIQAILEKTFNGVVTAHYTQITDAPLARLHILVKTTPGAIPEVALENLREQVLQVATPWEDALLAKLIEVQGERKGRQSFRTYSKAFPPEYASHYRARSAVYDIQKIEEALAVGGLSLDLFEERGEEKAKSDYFHLKIYNPKSQVPLSDILPMLENLGLRVIDEHPFLIVAPGSEHGVWIRDFRLSVAGASKPDIAAIKANFEEALRQVWYGGVENDGFNRLVLRARLSWRDVTLLRSLARYLKQAKFTFSQEYMDGVLAKHADVSRLIVDLFYARFCPKSHNAKAAADIQAAIEQKLADVTNLDEDRILRRFMDLTFAVLRTNYFQRGADGQPKSYISFKFDCSLVPDLPLPRPYREIFVYSTRIEGIHLRGGKVARGGLRWSDRREDFRTEVLGLMKAQMVKNAVIVPVGSKGGFVVKRPPAEGGREAFMAEGVECYRIFLRGLLDVTDNVVAGRVMPPKDVIRHDEDDPYLVVAADKGTATFSDYANGISQEYGFWLGDAFASGGSAGYDHKKMGITARGGWISVMRHFREIGRDSQKEDFTCIGIGDMSGDVFGNGMLLSEHIKLVGAFNHMHIFIDPNPDAKTSFKERQRLFNLPRSAWSDYKKELISKGGDIYERSAKSITISKEAMEVLGVTKSKFTPDELIRAMLLAPVDLLWNGGIGTYVKAASETHEQVGDRANETLRVDGRDLRCKVVGEGGNLGFTQKGRIEYALKGGKINTDAIDNSAGVDCSDHEVNIKIAFQSALEKKKITLAERDKILADMTDDVAWLVLRDNQLQTQGITIAESQTHHGLEQRARFIHKLEREGLLDRKIEFLPDQEELEKRIAERRGFTRPELAVMMAYSKMSLYNDLLASSLPDDPYFEGDLMRYFPKPMQEKFPAEIKGHQLRREIIATVAVNSLVNRMGITFAHQVVENTGMPPHEIAGAYAAVRDAFEIRRLWTEIEGLDGKVAHTAQTAMFVEVHQCVQRVTLWLLRNQPKPISPANIMETFGPGVREISASLVKLLGEATAKAYEKKLTNFTEAGVPAPLAAQIAGLEAVSSAPDIIQVARGSVLPLQVVAKVYFDLGTRLRLGWLRNAAQKVQAERHWDRLALAAVIDDLFREQRRLTSEAIRMACHDDRCDDAVEGWIQANADDIARYDRFLDDLKASEHLDLSMVSVALRKVQEISAVSSIPAQSTPAATSLTVNNKKAARR